VRSPRRYDPTALAAQSVDNRELALMSDAEGYDAYFAIVLTGVGLLQNRPVEDSNRVLEVDPVLSDVGRGFGFVPLERAI